MSMGWDGMGLDGMGYLQTGPFLDHLAVIKIPDGFSLLKMLGARKDYRGCVTHPSVADL